MNNSDGNQFQVDRDNSGRPTKIRGDFALPKAKTSELSVAEFLKSNSSELDLNLDPSTLRLADKAATPIGEILRYQQFVDNIPVLDSDVIVHVRQGKIKEFNLSHVKEIRIVGNSKAKKITPLVAYKRAATSLDNVKLRGKKIDPLLIFFPSDQGLILAYKILILTQDPMHDWRFIIDAKTGEILEMKDIIKEFPDGTGLVFDPNPVVTANDNTLRQPGATVATCGYTGSTVATLDAQRVTRTLKGLKLSGGVYSLDGPFAKIVDISTPSTTIPSESSPSAFTYSQSDDRFGAVNLYYNIDTIQRYIQSLGITTANNRQTNADPVVSGTSAYYSPGDKSLHMGTLKPCGPDKCQEGDAIIHEYGHAIQDNQVPGWGGTNPVTGRQEAGAMGEGFGDILACVFFANFGNQFQREVFEDWAYSYNGSSGLRRVDGTKVYPTDWSSEVHNDGEIWSAALWNIYRAIGGDSLALADREAARDALLKTVIISHHLLATNASMPDGAEAVMKTQADLNDYRGKYLMEMLKCFHDRGILKCDAAADLFIHDASSDTGAEPFSGPTFWESPDLWVRNADDGITSHQSPEYGQDNYFYARVTNRGTATARAFVVTFNVKPWAGTQFVYPNDFVPFVSAAVGFNLAPGASTILKAVWPASMLPPAGTHACLLGQVYMPTDTTPSGVHVWDKNNLAQKNMTVVDAIPGDTVMAWFQIGNINTEIAETYNVEVVRPPRGHSISASLVATNAFETKKLFKSMSEWQPAKPVEAFAERPMLRFVEHTRVELSGKELSSSALRLNLAPGSTIGFDHSADGESRSLVFERTARLVEKSPNSAEIEMFPGKVSGMPVLLPPRSRISLGLKLIIPKEIATGEILKFQVRQRNSQGQYVGGITIEINLVKSRTK